MAYTADQVLALSPDDSSTKAAKKLASSRWPLLGCSAKAVWGHCQGSGSKPYAVTLDLQGPAFKCSCPSRKFPCKHGLALFLLFVDGSVEEGPAPDWVAQWLAKRQQAEQARASRAEEKAQAVDPEAQARRQARRLGTMAQGLADSRTWLLDLAANGLASIQSQGYSVWDTAAARLVDAQAPGAAALVQRIGGITASGAADWPVEVARRAGQLFALIRAFERYSDLPAPHQADVRTALGWPLEKSEVLAHGTSQPGTWAVVGQSFRDGGQLREQRVWLYEQTSQTPALVLSFQAGDQPPDVSMVPGTLCDAELVFYPGTSRLRALVRSRSGDVRSADAVTGHPDLEAALALWADAKARNPWLSIYPLVISGLVPRLESKSLLLADRAGRSIHLDPRFEKALELLAISGGREITVAGEWEGERLLPLGCWGGEGFHRFEAEL